MVLLLVVTAALSSCGIMRKFEVKQHKKLYQKLHDGVPPKHKIFVWQNRDVNRLTHKP